MKRLTVTAVLVAISGPAFAGAGSGSFTGRSGHEASGTAEVVQTADGWQVRLGSDFRFDGAPDPRVGFGSGGAFEAGTDFEALRSDTGEQVYAVPATIDPADLDAVYIWCRQFAVPLAAAPIR